MKHEPWVSMFMYDVTVVLIANISSVDFAIYSAPQTQSDDEQNSREIANHE